eukprot:12171306-Prorocentrum_lima.AAC.1
MYGFRKGKGPMHVMATIRQLRAKCWEWGLPLHVMSLDINAAFDQVTWACLYRLLDANLPGWAAKA